MLRPESLNSQPARLKAEAKSANVHAQLVLAMVYTVVPAGTGTAGYTYKSGYGTGTHTAHTAHTAHTHAHSG